MRRVPGVGTQIRFKRVAELFCHAHLRKHAQVPRVDVRTCQCIVGAHLSFLVVPNSVPQG